MNKNQINTCIDAKVIDQKERIELETWLDSIDNSIDNQVPESLFEIVEKMCLYLNPAVGDMQ